MTSSQKSSAVVSGRQDVAVYLLVRLERTTAECDVQVSRSGGGLQRQEQPRSRPGRGGGWEVKGQPECPTLGIL